ncbi:MAG: hypothetical protein QXL16_02035 [Candidatus Micrarchaeaceae archaeon]
MDLLSKSLIFALVASLAIVAIYSAVARSSKGGITESDVINLIQSTLAREYPGASINVTNVSFSRYYNSWHVVVKIVKNETKPCPTYIIIAFDYPRFSLVNGTPENIYTSSCKVYGYTDKGPFIIYAPPVAIAYSYSLNLSEVNSFVGRYGYANVFANASLLNSSIINGRVYSNVWLVKYYTPLSSNEVYVYLSESNGTLIGVFSK